MLSRDNPILEIFSLPPLANRPAPADRSAIGTLPTRASRYCDAITVASGWGRYAYPPMAFSLLYDGARVFWFCDLMDEWEVLAPNTHFPGLPELFDQHCPDHLRGYAPPFLSAINLPGVVQIWTGLMVRTAPGWSSFVRAPSNLPRSQWYDQYEGIVETDRWFGPLFTNIRIGRTDERVIFDPEVPLVQISPIPHVAYAPETNRAAPDQHMRIAGWTEREWAAYDRTVVAPLLDPNRQTGRVAVMNRRHRMSGTA